jgi:DNA-binding SARP family transcriptional activator/pimeloyl-ACP methyl ester carboxylesterase
MDYRVLGPLEVGNPPLALGGGKQRALLAVLILNAGRTVARSRLIDDLWGERVPDTAVKMVQIYVSQLRKAMPGEVIVTRTSGYALDVAPSEVDLHRAEQMLAEGRAALEAGEPDAASATLRRALALWRGPALAEFEEPFAVAEAARIEELQLALTEERIDADLALGRQAGVVGELEPLIARHPLRERLRGQLMVALYRCGRQADALAAFHATRRALDEEIGLEPSPALRELERRILRQDDLLELPQPRTSPPHASPASHPGQGAEPASPKAAPVVRYARSADVNIAYEVTGEGPVDLVLVPGFVSHLTMDRAEPRHVRFLDRLASFARLIRFDKRGTGLSDRPVGLPDLETRMDDVRAVMDAAGSERAVLLGYSEGGPLALLFAAAHPERVVGLALVGSYAKRIDPDADYPWALSREERRRRIDALEADWGFEAMLAGMCPTTDTAMARWWGERCRAAASPGAVRALMEMNSLIDVRSVLPTIRAPTLVVHRSGDVRVVVGNSRYLAERIPGARYVELPGSDHFVAVDPDQILDVVEPWVRALPAPPPQAEDDAVLATILVVDAAGGEGIVREEVERHRGRVSERPRVAFFDGPTRATRCGLAIRQRLAHSDVRIGLHTGEVGGGSPQAVEVAFAVARAARPGEVLVSATTRDLVPGSGLRFLDVGERRLSDAAGTRRLFAALDDDAGDEDHVPGASPRWTASRH